MGKDYIYNSDEIKNVVFDNFTLKNDKLIIAGPCTFGSYEEIYSIAIELKKLGIKFLRAGVFKSRTNPYSFQGLQDEGIEILLKKTRRHRVTPHLRVFFYLYKIITFLQFPWLFPKRH